MNPFTIMRAKLRVLNSIINEGPPGEPPHSEQLTFCGVSRSDGYPDDGSDENNTFARWSPSVALDITIANPNLIGALRVGEEFYVDFSRPGNVTPEFAPEPLDFRQRVINEKAELDERGEKLSAFLGGPIFGTLPAPEQDRLKRQIRAMGDYAEVLGERIAAFDGEPVEAEPFKEPVMPDGDGKTGETAASDTPPPDTDGPGDSADAPGSGQ